jgi:hypothetical protein
MISKVDSKYIFNNAYVPEHLVDYVTSISDAEPYLFQHYACYKKNETLIFIGYPLGEAFDQKQMEASLEAASKALKPRIISLIAPTIEAKNARIIQQYSDAYYRLDLDDLVVPPKVFNMVRRASQEISVEQSNGWQDKHGALVAEFLATHRVSEESQYIFARIHEYVAASKSVYILNALDHKGKLIAFDIADYGSREYAFYMFNFASREYYVPGASDLLLSEMITIAREKGKRFVNLGLAINKGVTFFKQKWRGAPFLNHEFILYETSRADIISTLLDRL